MYLFCSTCQTQFPAAGRCPRCSSRLLAPGEAADALSIATELPPKPLSTTFGGRVLAGTALALGLHLGLREWLAAIGTFDESGSLEGYLAGYFLRFAAAMAGGLIAGAGRSQGFSGGATVGLIAGLGWLGIDSYPTLMLDAPNIGLMILIVTAAGCCALVGGRIWPPIVELPEIDSPRGSSLLKLVVNQNKVKLRRPTRWGRILVSTLVVLFAVIAADSGRVLLKKLPAGLINLGGPSAVSSVDFQIALVGIVLGGLIAGAGTGIGLRHGAIAGCTAAIAVGAAFTQQPPDTLPALEFVLDKFGARETAFESAAVVGLGIAGIGTLSGWLGGQLFPPLRKMRRRKSDFR